MQERDLDRLLGLFSSRSPHHPSLKRLETDVWRQIRSTEYHRQSGEYVSMSIRFAMCHLKPSWVVAAMLIGLMIGQLTMNGVYNEAGKPRPLNLGVFTVEGTSLFPDKGVLL